MANKFFSLIILILLLTSCDSKTNKKNGDEQVVKQAALNFKTGYSEVNGLKMYYEIYGEGKPLVLIHGGGSTIQTSFGRIIPELSKHRQVIGVELQGHGHTPDINRPETFLQDADARKAAAVALPWASKLKLGRRHLVNRSFPQFRPRR